MKILLFGKNGQVGWELNRTLLPLGQVVALNRKSADLSDPESLRNIVREIKPDVIVNAAAYTAVDLAEKEEELSITINALSPGVLAEEAKTLNALLVHYSTDYVFDGAKMSPYLEGDTTAPINAYGRSKLAGEEAIRASDCDHLILRTSWVYSVRGHNFLRSILRLASEREELSIVNDQLGSPTWARLIAETTSHILRASHDERTAGRFVSDLYNLTSAGSTSWFGFSQKIIELARHTDKSLQLRVKKLNPIPTSDYPTPASRPMRTVLSLSLIHI